VYARVAPARGRIERVVLVGPAHRSPVRGMGVSSADVWETPLGRVPVDTDARATIATMTEVRTADAAHADEHSLEVHLPFLQVLLGERWSLLPVVVGQARAADVADLVDALWGGAETLVVVSTDLSHYHDHDTARRLDAATAATVLDRRWPDLEPERACGAFPLRGLLAEADRLDLPVELLDLRTSGDTAGDRRRVVGYGAFAVG